MKTPSSFESREEYVKYFMTWDTHTLMILSLFMLLLIPLSVNFHLLDLLGDQIPYILLKPSILDYEYNTSEDRNYILSLIDENAVYRINIIMMLIGVGYAAVCLTIVLLVNIFYIKCNKTANRRHELYLRACYDEMINETKSELL